MTREEYLKNNYDLLCQAGDIYRHLNNSLQGNEEAIANYAVAKNLNIIHLCFIISKLYIP